MLQKYSYEEFESSGEFNPAPDALLKTKSELLQELGRPCSRFKSASTFDDVLDKRIGALARAWDPLDRHSLVLRHGIPLNWQNLVRYLRAEGITASERFHFRGVAHDSPKMSRASLRSGGVEGLTDGRAVYPHGFGASVSSEEAMSKAVGELLERHFLTRYREKDLVRIAPRDLERENAIDIFELNGFLPWQVERFPKFRRTAEHVRWVQGRELTADKHAYLPAQLVFWSYKNAAEEPILAESNTNGCAGHFTFHEAVVSSLLELIQRDGFMVYWLNAISPSIIDLTSITDPEVLEMLRYLRRYRLDCYFLDITTDIPVPTCVCVIVDRGSGEPSISIGAASGFNFRDMALQSIGEALSIHPAFKEREPIHLKDPHIPFVDKDIGRDERLYLWRGKEMFERFSFFLSGPKTDVETFMGDAGQYRTKEQQYEFLLDIFRKRGKGYEVYCYEVAHPVLKCLGYHVVQTIVPRLVRIYLREWLPTLDAVRLREVPRVLGYSTPEAYNPWPHPFP